MGSSVVAYMIIAAGVVTIYRLFTSSSGSISIKGFRASWSR